MKISKRSLVIASLFVLLLLAVSACQQPAPVDTSAADARIAELEAQLAEAESAGSDTAKAVADLEAKLAEAESAGGENADAVAALEAELAAAQAEAEAAEAIAEEAAAKAEEAAMMAEEEAMADLGTITFRLEWVASGYHAPFYLAQQEDLWRKHGLEVRITEGAGSGSAVEAVIGGAFDVALADRGVAATAASAGGDVVSVMGVVNKGALTVSCRADSGVASIDDLPGKTILTTISGSDGTLLPAFLNLAGINEADLTIQDATPVTKTSLLVEGLGDCSTFVSYVQPPLVSYGSDGTDGIELTNILWADHGLNIIGNGVITSNSFAEENPEALAAFVAGLSEAFDIAAADPDRAIEAYSRQFPRDNAALAKEQLVASLESLHNANTAGEVTGYQPLADWQSTIDALVAGGLIESALDYEAYFTNAFLPAE